MKNLNKKGSAGALVGMLALIFVVILVSAVFVVPWMLSLVETSPSEQNGESIWGSGPGSESGLYSTVAVRFQLTELVEINETKVKHRFWLWDTEVGNTFVISSRITADVNQVGAVGLVNFVPKTHGFSSGGPNYFEYVSDATVATAILSPGWYKYVLEYSTSTPEIIDDISWLFAETDRSEAGNVYEAHWNADSNKDGIWSEFSITSPYMSLVLGGNIITEPPDEEGEEEEDEKEDKIITTEKDVKEEINWVIYALIGGIIIVVMVAVIVMIRIGG